MKKYGIIALSIITVFTLIGMQRGQVREVEAVRQEPYATICHHNPSHAVTLSFQNENAYNGHLGTPHNDQVYDTEGVCEDGDKLDKYVEVIEDCDGKADVTVYGGKTRRTWRVNGEEKWVEFYSYVTWEDVEVPAVVEWWHEDSHQWKPADSEYTTVIEPKDCPTERWCVPDEESPSGYVGKAIPTNEKPPEGSKPWETGMDRLCQFPEPVPTPEEHKDNWQLGGAPTCKDGRPALLPWEISVLRNGSEATVNARVPEGNTVNVYYRENSETDWKHSVADYPVMTGDDGVRRVSVPVGMLNPAVGYTFGLQAANGCAGGEIVLGVVVDPPAFGVTFPFSYWLVE